MLTENRLKFLSYLRENPDNCVKGDVYFWDGKNRYCVFGMATKCFGLPLYPFGGHDDYEVIGKLLDLDADEIDAVARMNDENPRWTFAKIADKLERFWKAGKHVKYKKRETLL